MDTPREKTRLSTLATSFQKARDVRAPSVPPNEKGDGSFSKREDVDVR